jgi:hypothetical protein
MNMKTLTKNRSTHLLTAVLEISHEVLLDTVKFGKLHTDGFTSSLKVLSALSQVLTSLDSSRCYRECALKALDLEEIEKKKICSP